MKIDKNDLLASRPRAGVLTLIILASLIIPNIPILNLILAPLTSFTTAVHEMSHALACILTGGSVTGMSIVSDGAGHGGLTYSRGGIPFIITQAGYIGTALVGSLLISVGRFHKLSKPFLLALGVGFAISSLVFMSGTIFSAQFLSGLLSLGLSWVLAGALIWTGLKLNYHYANLVLLFLGVQCGLNAINDDMVLISQTFGGQQAGWSDATTMMQMTGIPAPLWAFLWTAISVGMLGTAIWWTYKDRSKTTATIRA